MLEIFEGRDKDSKLIRRIQGETIEVEAVSGYIIWLKLLAESKTILQLYISPHQLRRLSKYLSSGKWDGGIICPEKTEPDWCYIRELNDITKYSEVLNDIKRHREKLGDYPESVSMKILEAKAEKLKGSSRFGLSLYFPNTFPMIKIEWLLDDVKVEAERFLKIAKLAYNLREPGVKVKTDLTEWKKKLFEV